MRAAEKARIERQPCFVLHTFPYRETSLVAEVFSRDYGRLALLAKGARRPRSAVRGQLLEFQPLELSWLGGGELKTLAGADWVGGLPLLGGRNLLFGYYLSELVLRMIAREDPHPDVYASYEAAIRALSAAQAGEALLRRFELELLRSLGYGPSWTRVAGSGEEVRDDLRYGVAIERGVVDARECAPDAPTFSGRCLRAIARGDLDDAVTLRECKTLMRIMINHYLGGQPLHSRRVFMDLQEL